jgi:exonuclease SbcC
LEQTIQVWKQRRAELSFSSKEAAQKQLDEWEQQQRSEEAALTQAQNAVTACEKDIERYSAAIKTHTETLARMSATSVQEAAERKESCKRAENQANAALRDVHARLQRNEATWNSLRAQMQRLEQLEERLTWLRPLALTVCGNLTGREKVTLETYVQTAYFDRIIARANVRLLQMTKGQYELTRRAQAENLSAKSGLDLDVVDHYNGSLRSVKTLSGGESFLSSLALALGLSDEVQHTAGGVRLDTLFVDEGFGSLDENALAQAMDALARLADGHRLIGIISHVAELKGRIDTQIVVTKNRTGGSNARLQA